MQGVYITKAAKFLPNNPISNDEMELYLGMIDGIPSKGKSLTLRNNGIKTRYYSIDKQGHSTHSNAKMTALAIEQLTDNTFKQTDIELLACGTTSPDNLLPSHSVMVHGELNCGPIELISTAGACCASMQALKYGYNSILAGSSTNAVCTGSEKLSSLMRAEHYEKETERLTEMDKHPIIAFEKDFLRWMLSDGASALLLENKPRQTTSLKIEWLEIKSFANQLETCMYAGSDKNEDGTTKGWKEYSSEEWLQKSIFAFKQDTKLLGKEIVPTGTKYLKEILDKRNFDASTIDYFLPHLSSEFFRSKIAEEILKYDIHIPQEKWFTNLSSTGNIGSASIFIMIEELMNSGKLKKGQKILLMVPESARFTYAYCLLTVC
ncbi:MAG: beta-ketoacyl-ACP synthase III [Burkholderiales bacterium]|nr:beta-ketoacyl-ACP synthase III [Bacteroidia bacterium]